MVQKGLARKEIDRRIRLIRKTLLLKSRLIPKYTTYKYDISNI